MMEEAEVTKRISPEMESRAARRARDRAKTAGWDLDIALLLFAVLIIVIILSFQGIGIEIVASVAIFGLALTWFAGWRKVRQLYQRFYDEEISAGEIVLMCAWCGKEMYKTRSLGRSVISHGICSECKQKYFNFKAEGKPLGTEIVSQKDSK
jgi:Flp pilus assembly protein TadB